MLTQPTGQQLEQLQTALLAAFDPATLTHLVRYKLGLDLEWITPVQSKRDLTPIVADLVAYFASQVGGLKQLLVAACAQNQNNPGLLALASEWADFEFTPLSLPENHPSIQASQRGIAVGGDLEDSTIITANGNTLQHLDTGGGTNVQGNVKTGGDFVGRDKHVSGDEVKGDKVEYHIGQIIHQSQGLLDTSEPEVPSPGDPPYKGLQFFDVGDASIFHGREQLTAELVTHLRQERFLVVVGASGSGKSSLVRAGLVASLQHGSVAGVEVAMPKGCQQWPIYLFTPGARPLESLAASLTQHVESVTATSTLIDNLRDDVRSLHFYISRLLSSTSAMHLLLVVDQFEELFTLCRNVDEQHTFVDALLTAALDYDRTVVVMTLRADFYAHCARFDKLRAALDKYQKYIGLMDRSELQRAIEAPAVQGQWILEPELVQQMLDDVSGEPGSLPLLSHALDETWKRRRGRRLTLAGYIAAGGVKGAIAKTADKIYQDFSSEQQAIARAIFLRLTELGEGVQDTRRRVVPTELQFQHTDPEQVTKVIKALADERLVITDANEVQVTHEALIREWPRLRDWLEEDREGLRVHRRLTEAATEWVALNRDSDLLYRGIQLAQVEAWADQHESEINLLEIDFLSASRASLIMSEMAKIETERTRQRSKLFASGLALATLTVVIIGWFWWQANLSAKRAKEAEVNALTAQSQAETAAKQEANQREIAEKAQQSAEISAEAAREAQVRTEIAKAEVDRLTRSIRADQLTANGLKVLNQDLSLALLLANEGMQVQYRISEPVDPSAQSNVHEILDRLLDRPQGVPLTRHVSTSRISFSPDGRWLAASAWNNTVELWNVDALNTVPDTATFILSGHEDQIIAIEFSQKGDWLATGAMNNTIHLWDVDKLVHDFNIDPISLTYDGRRFTDITFSPDGRWFSLWGSDVIYVWDINILTQDPNSPPIRLAGYGDDIRAVTFSPDGSWLAIGSRDTTVVRLWKVDVLAEGSDPTFIVLSGHENGITSVVFSANGRWLASGSDDGTVRLWELGTLTTISTASYVMNAEYTGGIFAVAFSPDGRWLAANSGGAQARLWDINTLTTNTYPAFIDLSGNEGGVTSVVFSPDGRWLAVTSFGYTGHTARLWNMETITTNLSGTPIILAGHMNTISTVVFSTDGHWLVTSSGGDAARLWNLNTLTTTVNVTSTGLLSHVGVAGQITFSPSADRFAISSGLDDEIRLWDIDLLNKATTAYPTVLTGDVNGTTHVEFSSDERWLATAKLYEEPIYLWGIDTLSKTSEIVPVILSGHKGGVASLAFSPFGHWLATGGSYEDTTIRLWDMDTLSRTSEVVPLTLYNGYKDTIESLAFSPHGRWLAAALRNGNVYLWNFDDLVRNSNVSPVILPSGHDEWHFKHLAFSPDERWLATFAPHSDSQVGLWDLESLTQRPEAPSILLDPRVFSIGPMTFSPDGRWLAIAAGTDTFMYNIASLMDNPNASPIVLIGHGGRALAFSPDGQWLATVEHNISSFYSSVGLWNVDSLIGNSDIAPVVIKDGVDNFDNVTFSPDGRWLTVGAFPSDHLLLWRVPDLLSITCHYAGRNFTEKEWKQFFGVEPYRQTCPQWPVHPSTTQ